MNGLEMGQVTVLIISFVFLYFGIAWVLVRAYDDSRQSITDEIAEHYEREKEEQERKDIEWVR
jgi:hypothetical protein